MSSDSSGTRLCNSDLCFIDVETTGPIFSYHELIELGAVRVSADATTNKGELTFKLRPRHPERVTDMARAINGFSESAWRDVEDNASAKWQAFASFALGCIPVCHNPSFDRAFVTLSAYESGTTDLGIDYHWIGTETLAWPLLRSGSLPEFSLRGLCDFFGVPREPIPHSGLGGALTCLAVYRGLMSHWP